MSEAASRIYTGLGDDGTTGRFLGGRVSKDDVVVEACGELDETVCALGIAREALADDRETAELVLLLQRHLFVVAADLMANPRAREKLTDGVSRTVPEMVDVVERAIDERVQHRPLRPVFVVPGTSRASAALDLARAVCRRAERRVIEARTAGSTVSDHVVVHLNRLGDLLYVLARHAAGPGDEPASHS